MASRAPWSVPDNASDVGHLKLRNTITESVETFKPKDGKRVKWYTCGPTVYDVSHIGHARNYVTTDILRRVIEDYFGYEVFYQVNITDIDDKIILRARKNKLIEDYKAQAAGRSFEEIAAEVDAAVATQGTELEAKFQKYNTPLPEGSTNQQKDEWADLLKATKLKQEQFAGAKANIEAAKTAKSVEDLVKAGGGALGDWLDKEKCETVTDHSVFDAHARKYEEDYLQDMAALNVRMPDVFTRVTEYVPEIKEFIQGIINKGLAYVVEGSVLFDTAEWKKRGHMYPKLKAGATREQGEQQTSAEDMEEGEGALGAAQGEKRKSPNDFALWKASKPGEPRWESEWGPGRPGWHIECSVMAGAILGDHMDIHSGGVDLKFPHHDNEVAQSEAFFGHACDQHWVHYWLHPGHLHISGLKMSKSLKNFITIKQALEVYTPRQLRLLFLLQHWDRGMNFSDQTADDAKAKEATFKNFFANVKGLLRGKWYAKPQAWGEREKKLSTDLDKYRREVHDSLCNNIDTPGAMQALTSIVTELNKYMSEPDARVPLVKQGAMFVGKILRVFGVLEGSDNLTFAGEEGSANREEVLEPVLNVFNSFRDGVRAAAIEDKRIKEENKPQLSNVVLKMCDDIRDGALIDVGVVLEDVNNGPSRWKLDDPAKLKAEREAKEQERLNREAEKERKKKEAEEAKAKKEAEKKAKLEQQKKKEAEKAAKAEAAKAAAAAAGGAPASE